MTTLNPTMEYRLRYFAADMAAFWAAMPARPSTKFWKHKQVPDYYYDSIEDGKLMVYSEDGTLLHKKACYITPQGTFKPLPAGIASSTLTRGEQTVLPYSMATIYLVWNPDTGGFTELSSSDTVQALDVTKLIQDVGLSSSFRRLMSQPLPSSVFKRIAFPNPAAVLFYNGSRVLIPAQTRYFSASIDVARRTGSWSMYNMPHNYSYDTESVELTDANGTVIETIYFVFNRTEPVPVPTSGLTFNSGDNLDTDNLYGRMMSYSSKVEGCRKVFKATPKEQEYYNKLLTVKKRLRVDEMPIFMGIELEVQPRENYRSSDGVARLIQNIANTPFGREHCIIKSDASIGNLGFEIVTIPATLDYHKDMFTKHFFSKDKKLYRDVMSSESCGIHVHISKNCFSTLDLGKFMAFLNKPENAGFVDNMAGRKQNKYCKKTTTPKKSAKGFDGSVAIVRSAVRSGVLKAGLAYSSAVSGDRRAAVNVTNKHTIEVRIFKGSASRNNVLRKLEFCESLVKFVRQYSTQQMIPYYYMEFLLRPENRKVYPHLLRWAASKKFIGHEFKKTKDGKLVAVYTTNNLKKEG